MFINFWYAAEESANVTDKLMRVTMLGQDFVLFRDSAGQAHCLSDVCSHRGGSLGLGKLKGDCVECPYHGWQFNGEGVCTKIPSMETDAKIPSRAKVDSYPIIEKYGLIFSFLGDLPEDERPPIMEIPEYDQEGWRRTFLCPEFDFEYKRSIENGIDLAHNEFTHTTHVFTQGDDNFELHDLKMVETDWGTGIWQQMPGPALTDEKMRKASGRDVPGTVEIGTGHHGCASLWTYVHPSPKFSFHQYFFETPINEQRVRIFFINMRNAMLEPENDKIMAERNMFVVNQDRDVLQELRPVLTPRTNNKEVFVPADMAIARYRERIKEWQAKGWRIDLDEVKRNEGQVAYAIPSPARRASKGWALDSIPLLPGKSELSRAAE